MENEEKLDTGAVRSFIEDVWRPRIQGDGGEIRFVSLEGNRLTVKMQGECSFCPLATGRLKSFLEQELLKEFETPVVLHQIMDPPYYLNR